MQSNPILIVDRHDDRRADRLAPMAPGDAAGRADRFGPSAATERATAPYLDLAGRASLLSGRMGRQRRNAEQRWGASSSDVGSQLGP